MQPYWLQIRLLHPGNRHPRMGSTEPKGSSDFPLYFKEREVRPRDVVARPGWPHSRCGTSR